MYRAYDKLYSLGVGIPFTRTAEGVRMEGGKTLEEAIDSGMISWAMKDKLIPKIKALSSTLVRARWAHTDVKPDNVVMIMRSHTDFDVYLIDCEYALPFGESRLVLTDGVNGYDDGREEIVDANTDTMGFNATIAAVRNA